MKHLYQLITAVLLAGPSYWAAEAREIFHPIIDEQMRIISGPSESALYRNYFEFMRRVNGVQVELLSPQGGACQSVATHVTIEFGEYSPRQRGELPASKRLIFNRPGLLGVKVHFYNANLMSEYCIVRLWGLENAVYGPGPGPGPGPTPNPGELKLSEFRYVGAIAYDGGFSSNLELPVAPSHPLTHVWLRVPQYCTGAEILEVQWQSPSQWVTATALKDPPHMYQLITNGTTEGARIGGVKVLMNGPRNISCDIPVYMRILGPENPFEP
jgi:hypothetical protein